MNLVGPRAYLLCSTLFFLLSHTPTLAENPSAPQRVKQQPPKYMTLQDVVTAARDKNVDIIISDIGRSIAQAKVTKETSIFEPKFTTSITHNDQHVPTDAETAATLSSLLSLTGQNAVEQNDYKNRSTLYKWSVEELLPTGGTIALSTTYQDQSNDQIDANYPDTTDPTEYETVFAVQLRQPLLKGAWTDVTMGGITIAKTDLAIAQQTYRKKMMQAIYQAIQAFWNVSYAQNFLKIQQDSVELIRHLHRESKEMWQAGKMAKTELMQLRSGMLKRQSRVSQARQSMKEAENKLKNLLSQTSLTNPHPIRVTAQSSPFDLPMQFSKLLKKAYNQRPEYIASTLQAKRLDTQLIVARNNRLPQLDLKASFQRNGLDVQNDVSFQQALEDNFNSWSVGLEFTIPLGGDIKSRSELQALLMQKRQALLKIKSAEIAIANSVESSLQNVLNARDQLELNKENTQLMQELLDIEIQKLRSGHTTTRSLLLREDDLNTAKQDFCKIQSAYHTSLAQLALAQGSLLEQFDLEVQEVLNES